MNLEEKTLNRAILDLEKLAKIKTWAARIKTLAWRENDAMSEGAFCQKYGINQGRFNRIKNLKDEYLPSSEIMDIIESALSSEGV